MIKSWIVVGVLSFIAAIYRTMAGNTGVLAIARESNMDMNTIAFYHGSWYVNSVMTLITGVVFLYIGFRPMQFASSQIAILMIGIMIVTVLVVILVYSNFTWYIGFFIPVILLSVNSIIALYGLRELRKL